MQAKILSNLSQSNKFNQLFFRSFSKQTYPGFPSTVDLNLIGRCQLDCPWCWGPEHDAKEPVGFKQWSDTLLLLKSNGVKNVVFSGGEPLLKRWLPDLIKYAYADLGMRTTLSTNAILLDQKGQHVLPYLNEIGIPLDGPNDIVNRLMRVGKYKHFDIALNALKRVQLEHPEISLTVRTVVAQPNLQYVSQIGSVLLEHGINPKKLRWKLYQVDPVGPRKENILKSNLLITDDEFQNAVSRVKGDNPEFFVSSQEIKQCVGRYFIIFPDGNSHLLKQGADHFPENVPIGNIILMPNDVIDNLRKTQNLSSNSNHGCDVPQDNVFRII